MTRTKIDPEFYMKLGDAIALLPHVESRLARQLLTQARDGILEKLTKQMDSGDDPSAGYATIALRAVSWPEFEELFLEDA